MVNKKKERKKPVVLIILDGLGIRKEKSLNAFALAKTPVLDRLRKEYPNTTLSASGEDVGLPRGFIGNSEVGHLNIGAGRIVKEKIKEIDDAIKDRSFFRKKAFLDAIKNCKKNHSTLHLMGLIQMQGVHSMSTHLNALLELCKINNFYNVVIHAFTDGRDSPPKSAKKQLSIVMRAIKKHGVGRFVSLSGRYYAMDRDKRWQRTKLAYECIMNAKGEKFKTITKAVDDAYKNAETDEFITPRIIDGYGGIREHDSVIMFNFRLDRARQLAQSVFEKGFKGFKTRNPKGLYFASMTEYYKSQAKGQNAGIAFPRENLKNVLGEIVSKKGKTQFRLSETEKYAHVTYFFNAQREKPFLNEERKIVPSPKVATYDQKPEMSAGIVKKIAIEKISSEKYDLIVINFANPDMVGHTGKIKKAIAAVSYVDLCLGEIIKSITNAKGVGLIISDHGNCEDMSGKYQTSHTTNKVPCILIMPKETCAAKQNKKTGLGLNNCINNSKIKLNSGSLCDVAPTILCLMGMKKPKEMTGRCLIKNCPQNIN